MTEIYKDIQGYEGLYAVSNLGNVKSLEKTVFRNGKGQVIIKEQLLKPIKHSNGYSVVTLYKNKKPKIFSIHKLVAEAFVPNPNNLPYVNHKDENKGNNQFDNLEWCTSQYNTNYGTGIERRADIQRNNEKYSKKVLCVETGIIYPSIHEIKRQLGFSTGTISNCCNGRQNMAYKYHWKYVE